MTSEETAGWTEGEREVDEGVNAVVNGNGWHRTTVNKETVQF